MSLATDGFSAMINAFPIIQLFTALKPVTSSLQLIYV